MKREGAAERVERRVRAAGGRILDGLADLARKAARVDLDAWQERHLEEVGSVQAYNQRF